MMCIVSLSKLALSNNLIYVQQSSLFVVALFFWKYLKWEQVYCDFLAPFIIILAKWNYERMSSQCTWSMYL